MKIIYYTVFCTLAGMLCSENSFAQCTNGTQPECACETAPILCTIDELDNYSFSMTSYQHPNDGPSPICPGANQSQTNNPTWFAFTAWCTDLTLRVSADNCVEVGNAIGFQLAIYEDCTFNTVVACNADIDDCNTNDKILNINGLDIGEVYYFLVDGCLGSYCDVIIDVLGVCGQEEIAPWTQQINGDVNPCVGQTVIYEAEDLDGAGTYHWFIDGDLIELTDNNAFAFEFTAAGTYQLCVDASNDPCVPVTNDPPRLCTTIHVYAAEAGLINAIPTMMCANQAIAIVASGFNAGPDNAQALLITDESGLIVEVIQGATGVFSTGITGTYTLYGYNYIPALSALPAIGSSIHALNCNTACCDLEPIIITVEQISASFSAVECYDNGTGDDPSDDTFTFTVLVEGTGVGWEATDGTLTGFYNQPQVCGPYSIADGMITLDLQDIDVDGCVAAVNVEPPLPCSACNQVVDAGPGLTLDCYTPVLPLTGTVSGVGEYYWTGPGAFADTGLMITVMDSGWYYMTAVFPDQCAFTDSTYVSMDNVPPVAVAGPDQSLDCHGNPVLLDGSGSTGDGLLYEWTDAAGFPVAQQALQYVELPGQYILRVFNINNGCNAADTIEVLTDTTAIDFVSAAIMHERCLDESNGAILLEAISGGSPPFQFVLNEVIHSTDGIFIELAPGAYSIHITDDNGCELDTVFVVAPGADLQVSLPPFLEVTQGETGRVQAVVSVPYQQLGSVQWFPPGIMDCDSCLSTMLQPASNQLFQLTVMHLNGCEATAEIQINVVDEPHIYIPNIFSPNGDGYNDHFTLYSNDRVDKIKRLDVFDRWGEHVFHHDNFDPNTPEAGWDGTFHGKVMHPGLFTYVFELFMKDGSMVSRKGDITIIR